MSELPCACVDRDAGECFRSRYNLDLEDSLDFADEVCECACHQLSAEDCEAVKP
jgi:hypothetical protein